ncbi:MULTISPECIES: SRPBCC domain-containing protein [Arthrobacter]|uniref:SRPBCC domain-containing protein n=2 Tax=Arthrobacter TaxID=1663 RepID=A0ABU9KJJ6_9MICC|nr:SRPBCC domain-containing protein [Arthrobacter sp. YJM1]MDP5227271.1 SRPBCC domain-containing protein [Arthrobacter sp. YJM1]
MTESQNPNDPLEELRYEVFGFISRPVADVYQAVADPEQLSEYFTTGGAQGRLETGATVTWDFADFPGAFPVEVVQAERDRLISIRWANAPGSVADDAGTLVEFTFTPVDGGARTKVTVTESAWLPTPAGAQAAFGNCMGWTGMLAALKVWLEHGIVLRDEFYR